MNNDLVKKVIVFGIAIIFVFITFIPAVNSYDKTSDKDAGACIRGDTSGWSTDDTVVNLGVYRWLLLGGTAAVTAYSDDLYANLTQRGTRGLGVAGQEEDEIDSYDRAERIEITFDIPQCLMFFEVRSLFKEFYNGVLVNEEGDVDLYCDGILVCHYHLVGEEIMQTVGENSITDIKSICTGNGVLNISNININVDRIVFYVNQSEPYAVYSEFAVAKLCLSSDYISFVVPFFGIDSFKSIDVDDDINLEYAINADCDDTTGYEIYKDIDGSSTAVISIDGDNDGKIDHFIDTNSDDIPDKYWDPDDDILTDVYTLTIDIVGSGTVIKVPDQTTYMPDTVVMLTAVADAGWSFVGWTGDLTGTDNPDTIVMDGDKTVTSHFVEDQYTLIVTIDGCGSVVLDPDQPTYTYDTVVEIEAFADPGWIFSYWTGDLTGTENPKNVTMDGDKNVAATFDLKEYTLTILYDGTGNGTVTKDPDQTTYTHDTNVQLTAVENYDSDFIEWSDDLTGSANPDDILMDGDKTVTATFDLKEYTLTVDIEGTGEVNLDPLPIGGTYSHDTEVELTASTLLDPDWSFIKWTGDLDGSVNPETIIMNGDKAVTAWFMEGWTATLNFSANIASIKTDDLSFGESGLALDDEPDDFDLPKSPSPPTAPYVYAWFTTSLDEPYNILWGDYREFPAEQQVWDVWIEVDSTTGGTTSVKIAWNTAEIIGSGYQYVGLHNGVSGDHIVDMKDVSYYWFTSIDKWQHHFKIVCSNICPEALGDGPYTTNEAVTLHVSAEDGVLVNDVDDGLPESLTAHIATDVSDGTLNLNADGSFIYDPDLGFSGTDIFTYTAFDGLCHSDPATVTITVLEINHIALQHGWNLFSNPVDDPIDKTDIIVRYNNNDYTWDQADGWLIVKFIYGWDVNTYTFEDILEPGEGYWIWSNCNCEFLIPSNVEADDYITDLDASWNLIGIPNDVGLDKIDINIYYNGLLYTWEQAVTNGYIIDFVYSWDRTNQKYVITDDPGTFELGHGYWVYSYVGCALKIS